MLLPWQAVRFQLTDLFDWTALISNHQLSYIRITKLFNSSQICCFNSCYEVSTPKGAAYASIPSLKFLHVHTNSFSLLLRKNRVTLSHFEAQQIAVSCCLTPAMKSPNMLQMASLTKTCTIFSRLIVPCQASYGCSSAAMKIIVIQHYSLNLGRLVLEKRQTLDIWGHLWHMKKISQRLMLFFFMVLQLSTYWSLLLLKP